jgi:hypothetical protein
MKLRMNDKSVRLRLLRSEVERFRVSGEVTAAIQFPNGKALQYRLVAGQISEPDVRFTGDALAVVVPAAAAAAWTGGAQVGIYGSAGGLDVLVEKDFRRTSAASADDDDRYPNPRATR